VLLVDDHREITANRGLAGFHPGADRKITGSKIQLTGISDYDVVVKSIENDRISILGLYRKTC